MLLHKIHDVVSEKTIILGNEERDMPEIIFSVVNN